jgi:hypothetical protein
MPPTTHSLLGTTTTTILASAIICHSQHYNILPGSPPMPGTPILNIFQRCPRVDGWCQPRCGAGGPSPPPHAHCPPLAPALMAPRVDGKCRPLCLMAHASTGGIGVAVWVAPTGGVGRVSRWPSTGGIGVVAWAAPTGGVGRVARWPTRRQVASALRRGRPLTPPPRSLCRNFVRSCCR